MGRHEVWARVLWAKLDAAERAGLAMPPLYAGLPFDARTVRRLGHVAWDDLCEVVERIAAAPGGKEYGRLTIMLALFARAEVCFDVGPGAFTPPPKVWSTVVRLVPHAAPPFEVRDRAKFAALVAHLFSMRRKTLGRALKGRLTPEAIASVGLDPKARPETLAPADFARLAALES